MARDICIESTEVSAGCFRCFPVLCPGPERAVIRICDGYELLPEVASALEPSSLPHCSRPPPQGCSDVELIATLTHITRQLSMMAKPAAITPRPSRMHISEVVECIRQSTECFVWGERYDSSLFDIFCEHKMLVVYISALCAPGTPHVVRVQVLQTMSMLVQNAQRQTTVYSLLSGGHLNKLFDNPPMLEDEEIVAYFVSLLKGLTLRLDSQSARLFLTSIRSRDAQPSSMRRMPIFECAVNLVGHKDKMVQTVARMAVLQVLRLDDAHVRNAAEDATIGLLAPSLASISQVHSFDLENARLNNTIENMEGLFSFITDLFALGVPAVTRALDQQGFGLDARGVAVLHSQNFADSRQPPEAFGICKEKLNQSYLSKRQQQAVWAVA